MKLSRGSSTVCRKLRSPSLRRLPLLHVLLTFLQKRVIQNLSNSQRVSLVFRLRSPLPLRAYLVWLQLLVPVGRSNYTVYLRAYNSVNYTVSAKSTEYVVESTDSLDPSEDLCPEDVPLVGVEVEFHPNASVVPGIIQVPVRSWRGLLAEGRGLRLLIFSGISVLGIRRSYISESCPKPGCPRKPC